MYITERTFNQKYKEMTMPLVSEVKIEGTGVELPVQKTELKMRVESGYYNNREDKAVRLYSLGSEDREAGPKVSQVYVLQKDAAKELYDFLKRTFNF